MSYEILEWDSEFFGVPIGRVATGPVEVERLESTTAAADEEGIGCLYLLVPVGVPEALHAALTTGFLPYDVRVELDRTFEPADSVGPIGAPIAGVDDLPILERLAREGFTKTRFFSDPGFPVARVRELYARWVRRGVETFPERRTYLAEKGDGFITCRFDRASRIGTIELISVAARVGGNGVGSKLMRVANAEFARAGIECATVVTQGDNIAAQRLYQRNGYRTREMAIWLHRWAPGARGHAVTVRPSEQFRIRPTQSASRDALGIGEDSELPPWAERVERSAGMV